MTILIKHASAADLLAALPVLVGTVPHNSVVLLAFRGKRTHAALRFDLPARGAKRFSTTALGTFCKIPEVDGVVPVICSDAPFGSHDELLSTLRRRFEQAGFDVKDAFTIGSDGWGSHFDPDVPPGGRPLSEIERAVVVPAPAPPTRVLPADDLACRRMTVELARLHALADRREPDETEPDETEELEALVDLPFLAEAALEWDASELASRGALLLFALQGPRARDMVMLQWAFGLELGDAMWSADTCWGIEARKTYSNIDVQAAELMLGHGASPDSQRIESAIALLTTLISLADASHRRSPLCMLSWLNWALGRGTAAGIHIDEVREIDGEYSMGELLDTMFGRGILPEWLFSYPQISPSA